MASGHGPDQGLALLEAGMVFADSGAEVETLKRLFQSGLSRQQLSNCDHDRIAGDLTDLLWRCGEGPSIVELGGMKHGAIRGS